MNIADGYDLVVRAARRGAMPDPELEVDRCDAFRVLRDRVMAVPRRVAPAVVGLVEVREIELALADELRRALGLAGDDDAAMIPAVARMAEQALA